MPEEQGTWEPVAAGMLNVGDRARGSYGGHPVEGVVTSHYRGHGGLMYVGLRQGENPPAGFDYARRWERWVPATPPADSPNATPPPAFAPPQVGDRFNRTYPESTHDTRYNCEVTRVTALPNGTWRIAYLHNGRAAYSSLVFPDGRMTTTAGTSPGRFERIEPAAVEAVGWIPVTDVGQLRVGDTVRAEPFNIGGWMQAEVSSVTPGDRRFTAVTVHVIEPSRNGRARDLSGYQEGGYVYHFGEGERRPLVWRSTEPAPLPDVGTPSAAPAARGEVPVPEWATSLDAARRYVHAEAIRLYTANANCWDGTRDFLEAADLPTERAWPVPPPVDETAEIRAFLNQAREAALTTARDHGKSRGQVEEWLTRHGLNAPPPPPVEYTFTVTAPAGTTREDIINSARQLGRQGWEIN